MVRRECVDFLLEVVPVCRPPLALPRLMHRLLKVLMVLLLNGLESRCWIVAQLLMGPVALAP